MKKSRFSEVQIVGIHKEWGSVPRSAAPAANTASATPLITSERASTQGCPCRRVQAYLLKECTGNLEKVVRRLMK